MIPIPPTDQFLASWLRRRWRGFQTLLKLRRLLTGRDTIRFRTPYGSLFDLPPNDYIPAHVLRDGYYESEVLTAIRPYLGNGSVLWDIGANFGLHAVTAKVLSPATTVVAFEPNPAMIAEIRRQAALNHVDLRIASLALAATTAKQPLHVNRAGNPGMTTLHPWSEARYDAVVTVSCVRGDELINTGREPAPTVIKLDVEGGESAVLAGLGKQLHAPALRAIVFEADTGLGPASTDHPVAGPLLRAGFTLTALTRREETVHNLENYLATRA